MGGGWGGGGWIVLITPPPHFGEAKHKQKEKGCEYYGRNKGKRFGEVPHSNTSEMVFK